MGVPSGTVTFLFTDIEGSTRLSESVRQGGMMADTESCQPPLLDELASLDPQERRELTATLRQVSQTFAEVSDGKTTSHVLGVLAHLLDPS
jgi:hypothetical protein